MYSLHELKEDSFYPQFIDFSTDMDLTPASFTLWSLAGCLVSLYLNYLINFSK